LKITPEDLVKRFQEFKPEFEKSQTAIAERKGKLRPKPLIRALFDMGGEPSVAYLLRRGDAQTPGEPVKPGVLSVIRAGLTPYKIIPPTANSESRAAGWL
jgi:hypothetical protein